MYPHVVKLLDDIDSMLHLISVAKTGAPPGVWVHTCIFSLYGEWQTCQPRNHLCDQLYLTFAQMLQVQIWDLSEFGRCNNKIYG